MSELNEKKVVKSRSGEKKEPQKKKKQKRGLFIIVILLLVTTLAFGGYQAYRFFVPQMVANEELKKADEVLKDKPSIPKVPDKVLYEKGQLYGKLRIPSLNLEVALKEGLTPSKDATPQESDLLNQTVGHVATTKHAGQKSQIYLAGHNDMQFNKLGQLQDKAEIFIDMTYGTFKYIVHATPSPEYKEKQKVGMIVTEDRGDAIQPELPYEELVLQTCYPLNQFGNTKLRFLVYAYPEGQEPVVSLPGYAEEQKGVTN